MRAQPASMRMSQPVLPNFPCCCVLLLAAGLSACGGAEDVSRSDASALASPVDAGSAVSAAMPDATVAQGCAASDTRVCSCPTGGSGSQRCLAGQFSNTCEGCTAAVVSDRTTKCQPGRYVGTIDIPYYVPTPAGVCGFFTAFGGGGKGIMQFSMGASSDGEFVSVVGAASCLDLNLVDPDAGAPTLVDGGAVTDADGGMLKTLSLELSGAVSCKTGEFMGELRGTYRSVSFCDLGMTESDYFMKGPVRATFDPETQTFMKGTIDLKEPKVLFALGGEAGGSGTWEATLDPTAVTPPAPAKGCLGGVVFQDDLFK
jgi:hypothetical protein